VRHVIAKAFGSLFVCLAVNTALGLLIFARAEERPLRSASARSRADAD
jgi:hypothetical protein